MERDILLFVYSPNLSAMATISCVKFRDDALGEGYLNSVEFPMSSL